ncbi:MAG TPA: trigger factor [Alphaproteobacteria bacterium]|nr:trigger factor [Alphaproteobacteria bacterium]
MEVKQTTVDGLKHELKVVLSAKDLEEKIDRRLGELANQVRIPGFRPGKVPLSVLKKRYGDSVLGEVVERAISDSSERALTDHGLKPALRPKIEVTSFEKGTDLEYKMAFEVLPKIEPMDFTALTLERLVADIADKDVDDALDRLAKQQKRNEPAPDGHKAAAGDVVVIDFNGTVDGKEFPGGSAEGYFLELGANQFIPGFEDQLVGSAAGAKLTVHVTFPADYPAKELAGKPAKFEVAVKEVRIPLATAIDERLATDMGLENLEALRKSVRERIEREYADVSKQRLKRALLDALAAAHDFQVPAGMVDLEFEQIWRQIEEGRKGGTLDPEDTAKTDDELKAEYRAIAERRVRLGLLLSEVGQRHNIAVAPEEVNRAMIEEARRFPGQERKVLEYFKNSPEAVAQLRAPIFEAKVVDFIVELAKPKERRISIAELLAEPEDEAKGDAAVETKGAKSPSTRKKSERKKPAKAKEE